MKEITLLKISLLHGVEVFIALNCYTYICHFSHEQETNVSGDLLCPLLQQMTLMKEATVSKILSLANY